MSLIITDNQAFFTTSLPTSPILTMIHRTKQMTESKSNVIFEVPTRLHRESLRTEASKMWLMLTDMKHTTVRKVRHNLSKSSFFKLFAKFAHLSVVPWYRYWATRVQNRGEKNKKAANFVHFSKGCVFFFGRLPERWGGR